MLTELAIHVKNQSEHIKKLTTRIEQLEEQVHKNGKTVTNHLHQTVYPKFLLFQEKEEVVVAAK